MYKLKQGKLESYYTILDALILSQFIRDQDQFKILNQWNFKNYQHHNQHADDEDRTHHAGMKIYPALYPLNKNEMSIAIVNEWFGGYAGGGVSEQYADFLKLQSNGKYALAVGNVHFYSSEMIRACFSEKDYHTSPHCHDESGTVLNIKFNDVGNKYYQWTLALLIMNGLRLFLKNKKISKRIEMVIPFS